MLNTEYENIWLGTAVLMLAEENSKRSEGFIGAFSGFACKTLDIAEAVRLLCEEFKESGYLLIGIEGMTLVNMLDRELTSYEEGLIAATAEYPVQFKNVHLHKGDA